MEIWYPDNELRVLTEIYNYVGFDSRMNQKKLNDKNIRKGQQRFLLIEEGFRSLEPFFYRHQKKKLNNKIIKIMRNRIRSRKQITIESIRVIDPLKLIKIQLDLRTIVTVKDMTSFEKWLVNFPNAKIITN